MNKDKELKKNLENFIEIFELEKGEIGETVHRNEETHYHYLGSEYEDAREEDYFSENDPENDIKVYELTKHINYFSKQNNHKSSNIDSPSFDAKECGYDVMITISEEIS